MEAPTASFSVSVNLSLLGDACSYHVKLRAAIDSRSVPALKAALALGIPSVGFYVKALKIALRRNVGAERTEAGRVVVAIR